MRNSLLLTKDVAKRFCAELGPRANESHAEDPALRAHDRREIHHVFPGSWIDATFDIWIGADEDNRAWEYLREARAAFDRVSDHLSTDAKDAAYEELLIAEGSD